jgi:hypothetical protein
LIGDLPDEARRHLRRPAAKIVPEMRDEADRNAA